MALAVLVAVLFMLSVVSSYVRGVLLDTDTYVEVVAPLASDSAVQAEVVDAVTTAVVRSVPLDGLPAAARPLVQRQLEEVTRSTAGRVVESPRFADLWADSNRLAHRATVAALRDQGSVVRTGDGTVRIDVGSVVEEVKRRLVENGFAQADRIPTSSNEIVLVESAELANAQRVLLLFDQLAPWLPWVSLALATAAVLVAPIRRRGLLWVACGVGVAMIILAIVLAIGRGWLLDRVAGASVDPAAANVIVDAVLGPLWSRLWLVLLAAVVVAAGALLAGPVGTRLQQRIAALRHRFAATR